MAYIENTCHSIPSTDLCFLFTFKYCPNIMFLLFLKSSHFCNFICNCYCFIYWISCALLELWTWFSRLYFIFERYTILLISLNLFTTFIFLSMKLALSNSTNSLSVAGISSYEILNSFNDFFEINFEFFCWGFMFTIEVELLYRF